mgnify:CR=1 FL=1
MKNVKNFIAGFIVLSAMVSCKNEKSVDELPVEKQAVAESPVQIVVNMTVKKDDILEIFYTEDGSLDFGPKSVRVDVPGKSESQQVVFEMPDDAKLTSLRFDVGQNPDQEEMTIDNMIIKQNDKEFEISGADFFKYFNTTDFVKPTQGGSFKTVKINGVYDPFVHNKGDLIVALKGLQ